MGPLDPPGPRELQAFLLLKPSKVCPESPSPHCRTYLVQDPNARLGTGTNPRKIPLSTRIPSDPPPERFTRKRERSLKGPMAKSTQPGTWTETMKAFVAIDENSSGSPRYVIDTWHEFDLSKHLYQFTACVWFSCRAGCCGLSYSQHKHIFNSPIRNSKPYIYTSSSINPNSKSNFCYVLVPEEPTTRSLPNTQWVFGGRTLICILEHPANLSRVSA